MFQFSPNFRNLNKRMSVARQLPLRSIKARTARWVLALFTAFSGLLSAFAQTATPGCLPYTTTYPCIYVANFGANEVGSDSTVSVINATTNGVVGSISTADLQGTGASGVAVTPNNAFAYVALQFSDAVAIIDTSTNKLIKTITLTSQPSGIAISPNGAFAWVTEVGFGYAAPMVQAIDTAVTPPGTAPAMHTVTTGTLAFTHPTAITFSLDGATAYVADTCGTTACVDVINTSKYVLTSQIPLSTSLSTTSSSFENASIAITQDGSLVCVSVQVPTNPSSAPVYGIAFLRTSDLAVISIATFSQFPDSIYGLGITQDGTLYAATSGGIVVVNTTLVNSANPPSTGLLQFGTGPAGIAVATDGATIYVTNLGTPNSTPAVPPTVSVIKGGLLIATITGVGISPKSVAVMHSLPPMIVTQPSSQTIGFGQPATLSVTATGTPPLAYQWYQGQSGDTSNPIAGATSSSYTTPAQMANTSYWVAVGNLVTQALVATPLVTGTSSTTATIMPTLHAPTCTLSLQGTSSFLMVAANANCTDPQQESLVTTLNWNDGSTTAGNGGVLVVNKTYSAVQIVTPYIVTVTTIDTSQLTGTMQVPLYLSPLMTAFAGQSAGVPIQNVPAQSLAGGPVQVVFTCYTVTDSNGHPSSPESLGISCSSSPSVITLDRAQSVTITVDTTGSANSVAQASRRANWFYAFLLPIPAFLLLGVRCRTARTRSTGIPTYFAVFTAAVILQLSISCGGGFTTPKVTPTSSTPAGSYQITVVDNVVGCQTTPCQNPSGFIQTTLIVPLTVSPTQ